MTLVSVRSSMQPDHDAGVPLAHAVAPAQVLDHLVASRRLQNFFASTSCSMVWSSASSATSHFSRWFSSGNCFNCRS